MQYDTPPTATFSTKGRILQKLGLGHPAPALPIAHVRETTDLLGDRESFLIQATAESVRLLWRMQSGSHTLEQQLQIGLSPTGRAVLSLSSGFEPPVRTVSRAIELAQKTLQRLPLTRSTNEVSIPSPSPLPDQREAQIRSPSRKKASGQTSFL